MENSDEIIVLNPPGRSYYIGNWFFQLHRSVLQKNLHHSTSRDFTQLKWIPVSYEICRFGTRNGICTWYGIVCHSESSRVYSSTNENTPSGCCFAQSCLDSANYWLKASTDSEPFITIDMGVIERVYGVVVQGSVYADIFTDINNQDRHPDIVVTVFQVKVSVNGWSWKQVEIFSFCHIILISGCGGMNLNWSLVYVK